MRLHPSFHPRAKTGFAGSAIIFNQDGMQVAVVENGVAHLRKSAVTADYGTEVEVNDGVKSGDQVILQPPVDLADGGNVQIIPEPPQPRRELIPRARERLPVRSGVALMSGFRVRVRCLGRRRYTK